MSFSPHYNKLQLKRGAPKGTHSGCWDFAFHANLLMYTPEIYLRTKSKNEILKPWSQGSIWKANRANIRSMCFHTRACNGSSWKQQDRGIKAGVLSSNPGLQPSMLHPALFSPASHNGMGQHQEDKLLLSPPFTSCFPKGFGGPSQQTKHVLLMWLHRNKNRLLSEQTSQYPPLSRSEII